MTDEKFMEDCAGKRIKLGVGTTKVMGQEVDCIRIRLVKSKDLNPKFVSEDQLKELINLLISAEITEDIFSKSYKIKNTNELPANKFENAKTRLVAKAKKIMTEKEGAKDANNN